MLRIKRSVQAAFNTEASYIAAQAAAARLGKDKGDAGSDDEDAGAANDPMAALEGAPKGPSFVAAKQKGVLDAGSAKDGAEAAAVANPDESESPLCCCCCCPSAWPLLPSRTEADMSCLPLARALAVEMDDDDL